jgi:DNA-nicking Smr family endonuclease
MEPVKLPIEDVLDLHTFNPRDVKELLEEYFILCIQKELFAIRVIHGKGKGILKKRVHSILKQNRHVKSFYDAQMESGGWGATIVELIDSKT